MARRPLQARHVHPGVPARDPPRSARCHAAWRFHARVLVEWLGLGVPQLRECRGFRITAGSKGIDCARFHRRCRDARARADAVVALELPAEVRRLLPAADRDLGGLANRWPLSTPVARALYVALVDWVVNGTLPPPSVYPRIADKTAVAAESSVTCMMFNWLSGLSWASSRLNLCACLV